MNTIRIKLVDEHNALKSISKIYSGLKLLNERKYIKINKRGYRERKRIFNFGSFDIKIIKKSIE